MMLKLEALDIIVSDVFQPGANECSNSNHEICFNIKKKRMEIFAHNEDIRLTKIPVSFILHEIVLNLYSTV